MVQCREHRLEKRVLRQFFDGFSSLPAKSDAAGATFTKTTMLFLSDSIMQLVQDP